MSLDDKLREILRSASISGKYGETHEATYLELTAQIKQAFADEAGFTQLMQDTLDAYVNMKYDALRLGLSHGGTQYLSGQEWYTRFKKEAEDLTYLVRGDSDKVEYITRENVDLAAKRASGVTNE